VQGSRAYWERHGFADAEAPLSAALTEKLASFGSGATLMRRSLTPV